MSENLDHDAFGKLLDRINSEATELVEITVCLKYAILKEDLEEINYSLSEMRRLVRLMENYASLTEKLLPVSNHE